MPILTSPPVSVYQATYAAVYGGGNPPPPPPPPGPPPVTVGTLPQITVQAAFGASAGSALTWTDISAYVRSGDTARAGSRLAGPLWQYQAGTATVILKNGDGRFDPRNLTGPYTSHTGLQVITRVISSSGTWTAPENLVGDTVKAECWGGGGAGGSTINAGAGGGVGAGGGGEYAAEQLVAVTPGVSYPVVIGAGGAHVAAGTGGTGGTTTFTGDSLTVTAHGGGGGLGAGGGGAGGSGSVSTIHFNGGAGGSNPRHGTAGYNGGAGGGSSAGPAGPGIAGNNTSSDSGATGGAAVAEGGPGGQGGGGSPSGFGTSGRRPASGPGGGGGGAWGNTVTVKDGGDGWRGKIRLTYVIAVPVAAAVTQVLPMTPVRAQMTWNSVTYPLFSGYATSWQDAGLNNPRYAETALSCTDGMYILAAVTLPTLVTPVGAGEDTGARINRILDAAGWPEAQRDIDDGDTSLQAATFGDTALNLIQAAAETEIGEFYIDAAGNAVFRRRTAVLLDPASTTVQCVLGDRPGTAEADGTEAPYTMTQRVIDDTALFNDIQNTRTGGILQESVDLVSVAQYGFARSYSRTDLLQLTDAEALQWTGFVLHVATQVNDRSDTIQLNPQRDTAALYPQVGGRDFGDLIEVWRRPPGVAGFSEKLFLRGVTHAWDYSARSWTTTWTLQDSARFSFFILGDPVKGRLDLNALSF